jgi:HpcH/HpaI aldolase/citrate lyase family protein
MWINGTASSWFKDDLALCAHPGVCAIVLPKAESAEELQALAARAPDGALLPLIETAQGFEAMRAIAPTAVGGRMLSGSIDFQLDLQIASDDEALLYVRSRMVLVSRLAGVHSAVSTAPLQWLIGVMYDRIEISEVERYSSPMLALLRTSSSADHRSNTCVWRYPVRQQRAFDRYGKGNLWSRDLQLEPLEADRGRALVQKDRRQFEHTETAGGAAPAKARSSLP